MQREALIAGLAAGFRDVPGGLLLLLRAVRDAIGFIPAESVSAIATGMGLSRAQIWRALFRPFIPATTLTIEERERLS